MLYIHVTLSVFVTFEKLVKELKAFIIYNFNYISLKFFNIKNLQNRKEIFVKLILIF